MSDKKQDWFDKHVIITGNKPKGWPDDWQKKLMDKFREEAAKKTQNPPPTKYRKG